MAYARRKVPVSIEMVCEIGEEAGFVHEMVKEDKEEGIWVYKFRYKEQVYTFVIAAVYYA